ncbi:MAG: RNA polymerase sigma factor, partial [Polyangiales bacterium]
MKSNRDPIAPVLRLVRTPAGPDRGPAPALDDSELLAAVRRGDSSAARALYDRCRPLVDRTIARLLGRNDPDRSDVAQLASIEIVRSLAHYRGECALDSWIARITARAVYRTIRARRSERANVAGETDPDQHENADDLEGDALRRSLLARVHQHLERLDADRAFAFVLHDVWGYDLKEIAEITQVSVTAAQSRLVRGRRELHERLAHDPALAL